MPPKAHHRAGTTGLLRTHSRSSSAGSSKAALNLHFTQKDPASPTQPEKAKKNGHVCSPNSSSFFIPHTSRGNGTSRVSSREQLQTQDQRYALPPNQRQQGGKPKPGFTLSSPTADDDDDWVSSESGAATPDSDDSDARSQTPVNQRRVMPAAAPPAYEPIHRPETPRAQHQPLSRVPTIRPPEAPVKTSAVSVPPLPQSSQTATVPPTIHPEQTPQPRLLFNETRVMETRSANTSPVPRSRRSPHGRQSVTRPPSMHSTSSRLEAPLRPHPLIRGKSFGQNAPMSPKVVPLVPLTVALEASPVSSPDPAEMLSTSPSSVKTTYAQPSANRRTSVSSARSVATLPSQSQFQAQIFSKTHDRNRTLSSMSSTSSTSVRALSSLAHLPATRPSTPQYSAHFPPAAFSVNVEAVHPLLPPPYLSAHMSILMHRSPLRESYERVIAAREQQKR
ncbi:hypothetical protein BU15DRAFT_48612 [Melanogaster broomeanus]|nr:hypothetical protein BU15DRAFT_48612 [Melanogaster broomeanus]